MAIGGRIRSALNGAWNAFVSNEEAPVALVAPPGYSAYSTGYRPDRSRPRYAANGKTIISSIYTRMTNDVAAVPIRHVKVDDQGRYSEDMKSRFNVSLTIEPNLDQSPQHFRRDIVRTLFEDGCAAIVPIDTIDDPNINAVFDIVSLRVGRILNWYADKVRVSVYNERRGIRQEIILDKKFVAIVENPFYDVMNEPNSTLMRLNNKLTLLDVVDNASSSGKLDLIIQLPYMVKGETKIAAANARRDALEDQLKGSTYGVAWSDATEKITQLNRPIDNNLLKQVEDLTAMLYDQLGITPEILNGTADEKTMTNYEVRVVKPILDAIIEAMGRTFLGHAGIRKNERIMYFREPFKFAGLKDLSEAVDVFSRNEIFTPNEIRGFMGVPPSGDPKSDQLQNSNMPAGNTDVVPTDGSAATGAPVTTSPSTGGDVNAVNAAFDEIDSTVTQMFKDLGVDSPPDGSSGSQSDVAGGGASGN